MRSRVFALLLASTAIAVPFAKRDTATSGKTKYSSGNTASDVQDGVCAPLTVIFARGTTETGNIGTVIGPPMFAKLSSLLDGNVALQGVNYAADFEGDIDGGAEGAPDMTSLAKKAKSQCPKTKVALSGYSQGGLVVHYALNQGGLPSSDVDAIVYFGDPLDGVEKSGSVATSKIKEYCASGDGVCEDHGFFITEAHLSYGDDATAAADFIIKTTGVQK